MVKSVFIKFSNNPVYSHKSDVWSFGITVWEILTYCDKTPYTDEDDFNFLKLKFVDQNMSEGVATLRALE